MRPVGSINAVHAFVTPASRSLYLCREHDAFVPSLGHQLRSHPSLFFFNPELYRSSLPILRRSATVPSTPKQDRASPAETATILITINFAPTISLDIYRGEWVQSIITTPGIDKVPCQTRTGRRSYTFDISNSFRLLPTISHGGDPCAVEHSSSEVRRIESVTLSFTRSRPRCNCPTLMISYCSISLPRLDQTNIAPTS